ncbi:MAG: tRNA lysidine(34) synthetase TilS [Nitrospirae bacterium]|nr:tRNA lysidine(34) synthetase TilS [Nitrospirota bacterium]
MNIRDKIKTVIKTFSMLSEGDTVLVGLSGGPDSVTLLLLLRELEPSLNIHAIYIDHGLRPHETPDEIEFCKQLCCQLNVPFVTRAIDDLPDGQRKTPALLREIRYRLYEETAFSIGASRIALGHNKDDQAETIILNLLRGAAMTGMSGIAPVRGRFIRPLIDVPRLEIEAYLNECKQTCCLDSSNLKDIYLRNRVRRHLMPALLDYNPNIVNTLTRNAQIIREENAFIELAVTKKMMTLVSRKKKNRIELFLLPLQNMEIVLLRRLLKRAAASVETIKELGALHIEEIMTLIRTSSTGDRLYLPGGIRVIRGYSTVVITSEPPARCPEKTLPLPGEVIVREVNCIMRTTILDRFQRPEHRRQECLDADLLSTQLKIRARVDGDYFYPLGLGKRKKVQDYLVDEKIPRDVRQAIPLVFSGDTLVWIAGHRADDRFKVTQETKRYCLLELIPIKYD